jgi:hypothetical protein
MFETTTHARLFQKSNSTGPEQRHSILRSASNPKDVAIHTRHVRVPLLKRNFQDRVCGMTVQLIPDNDQTRCHGHASTGMHAIRVSCTVLRAVWARVTTINVPILIIVCTRSKMEKGVGNQRGGGREEGLKICLG